jgi:hypothetical protein
MDRKASLMRGFSIRLFPDANRDDAILDWVTDWLGARRSLLAPERSQASPRQTV